jgi:hypothetical protein
VTFDFYRKLVSKQDETIADLMAQEKEHQKTLRMAQEIRVSMYPISCSHRTIVESQEGS